MLSFEISHLPSTTDLSAETSIFRQLVSSWAGSSVIKRNSAAKLDITAGE